MRRHSEESGRYGRTVEPAALRAAILVTALGIGTLLAPVVWAEDVPYPHGDFEDDCSKCHSPQSWHPAVISDRFDHGRASDFVLEGAHESAMCRSCHLSLEFSQADPKCVSCHLDVHNGELGLDCAQCHSTANFIDHADEVRSHRTTRFPLTGSHTTLDCIACHPMQPSGGLRFVNTRTECESCHLDAFMRTTEPNHVTLEFDRNCAGCHATTTWNAVRFDRFDHTVTGFPLAGAHRDLDCAQCHTGGGFTGVAADCLACHQSDYESTRTPDHVAGGFPTDCQQCHGSQAWSPAGFDHDLTGFPLTGSHGALTCERCHTGGTQTAIEATCISCHSTDYDQAPSHVTSSFPTTCEQCHNTIVWSDAVFQHDFFPFVGGHSGLSCQQCHTSGTFGTIPADCFSCHDSDYQQAPGHAGSFPTTCEDCHSLNTWADVNFDHDLFPLTDAHAGVDCVQCHTSGTFGTISADCFSCHQETFQTAPGHVTSGFSQNCEECHRTTTWADATFDHSFFPLSGGHNGIQCLACHTSGTYGTIPADCFSCHDSDYQQAPGHAGSFPTTCEDCHAVTTWADATFDHSFFPLTGGHNGPTCQQCHTNGTYGTIPTDCIFCHQADYVEAPSHVASNFPQDCQNCHSITVWSNATFDHSFFPLTGGHNALQCVACHTSGVYATIPADCYSCHQSDYAGAPDHLALSFPRDCESCHDTGNWQNTSFFHSFPLTSPHDRNCNECHVSGTTEDFSCYGTCHKHDQAKMNDVHSGEPGYAYDFQLCLACHPNGRG